MIAIVSLLLGSILGFVARPFVNFRVSRIFFFSIGIIINTNWGCCKGHKQLNLPFKKIDLSFVKLFA